MTVPVFSSPNAISFLRPDRFIRQLQTTRRQSPLNTQQISAVIDHFDLFLLGPAQVASSAGRNDSWILPTTDSKKILKRYTAFEDPAQITHEHSILAYLDQAGFPAPRLVPSSGGHTTVEVEGKIFALFDFYDGYFQFHNYLFFPSLAREFIGAAGKVLASVHLILKDFTPAGFNPSGFQDRNGPRWRELDWYLERLETCRLAAVAAQETTCEADTNLLVEKAGWLEKRLQSLDQTLKAENPTQLIIHGDFGPYNLFFKQGSPVVLLDFELARLDWRLLDFVLGFTMFAKNRLGFNLAKMEWLLRSYQSVTPVPPEELRLLPVVWQFIALRRAVMYWDRSMTRSSDYWLHAAVNWLRMADWAVKNQAALEGFSRLKPVRV